MLASCCAPLWSSLEPRWFDYVVMSTLFPVHERGWGLGARRVHMQGHMFGAVRALATVVNTKHLGRWEHSKRLCDEE